MDEVHTVQKTNGNAETQQFDQSEAIYQGFHQIKPESNSNLRRKKKNRRRKQKSITRLTAFASPNTS